MHLEQVSGAIDKVTGNALQIASLVEGVQGGSAEQARGIQLIVDRLNLLVGKIPEATISELK
jgi:hypothetical protein